MTPGQQDRGNMPLQFTKSRDGKSKHHQVKESGATSQNCLPEMMLHFRVICHYLGPNPVCVWGLTLLFKKIK